MARITGDIAFYLLILNCILYFKSYPNFWKPFKFFTLYIFSHTVVEIGMRTLSFYKLNNHFMTHIYFVMQFLFLSLFFYELIEKRIQKKIILNYMLVCFSALILQYVFNPVLFFKFNLLEIFITTFPLIIYATFYLFEMLEKKKEFYMITIALIVYLFGSTIVFLFGNILNNINFNFSKFFWSLNTILYLLFQVIVLIEWLRNYSKKPLKSK